MCYCVVFIVTSLAGLHVRDLFDTLCSTCGEFANPEGRRGLGSCVLWGEALRPRIKWLVFYPVLCYFPGDLQDSDFYL